MHNIELVRQQLKRVNCETPYGAYIEAIELKNGVAIVTLSNLQRRAQLFGKASRSETLHLNFSGVVFFKSFEFGGDLSEIRLSDESDEIREAIHVIENDGGTAAGYPNLVQASFVAEAPLMIIVFQQLNVQNGD